ncbi:MAG: hypothetical protein NTW87_13600 [Planctomycetota bacterium]|nr:hypothetical protein [Planctomycetota bacterium]
MLTAAKPRKLKKRIRQGPVVLRSREEASAYIAKHAKPIGHSPKGRPIYGYADLKRLDVQYPAQ